MRAYSSGGSPGKPQRRFQPGSIPSSLHHFRSWMFCSAVVPLRISLSTGSLKLSMPGWMLRTPASRSRRSCSFLRLALTS